MHVIATFTCADDSRCRAKMDTVVVSLGPGDVDEIISKLSVHSCYYQSRPVGYRDVIVAGGDLLRCELLPEIAVEELRPLAMDEFRRSWADEDCRRDGLKGAVVSDARSRPTRKAKSDLRGCRRGKQVMIQKEENMLHVVATFTHGSRSETKADTVVVQAERRDVLDVIAKLAVHSCYYQSCPAAYQDLIVLDGELHRCELLPESQGREAKPLGVEEFRKRWGEQHEWHLDTDRDWRQRLRLRKRAAINRMPGAEGTARERPGRKGGPRARKRLASGSRKM